MGAFIHFLYAILDGLLGLLVIAIIISAVLSWLVAFDVINLRNRYVYNIARFLDAVTRPLLAPVQRIIPPLGGVDISPIIVLIVISGIQRILLPPLATFLVGLVSS
jgi:YggT family protein